MIIRRMISRSSLDDLSDAILGHLAASPELMEALVSETGLLPADLRALAAQPTVDRAVALVDFICASDERLGDFAAASGWSQTTVAHTREALSAGVLR
jgi:hypothetical protein